MSRRAKGEGSVHKRASGGYGAYLTLPSGKRKWFYAQTRRAVGAKLLEAQQAQAAGRLVTAPSQPLARYLATWLEGERRRLRPASIDAYSVYVRHISREIGAVALAELRPQHVEMMEAALLRRGLAASTCAQIHAMLKSALRRAVETEMLFRNVCDAVRPPRVERREMRALSQGELRALWQANTEDTLHPLWVLLGSSGLRLSEALGLAWEDVRQGRVHVRRQLARSGKTWSYPPPKSTNGLRSVPLPAYCQRVLEGHRKRQRLASKPGVAQDLVFCREDGKPCWSGTIAARFREARERAEIGYVRCHDLRHTCATLWLANGLPVQLVSRWLGHASITITLNLYVHVDRDLEDRAQGVVDVLFRGLE